VFDFQKCSVEQYRDIAIKLTKHFLEELGATVSQATSSSIDLLAKMPKDETLGVMVQCDRFTKGEITKTFEQEDQDVLLNVSTKMKVIPAVALVEVNAKEPGIVKMIISKLDVLTSIAKEGKAIWLKASPDGALLFHCDNSQECIKTIKATKGIWYHSFAL
jgi:hypothetical protein